MSLAADARAIVERTCSEQGLPPHVTDPAGVARLAALLTERSAVRSKTTPLEVRDAGARPPTRAA